MNDAKTVKSTRSYDVKVGTEDTKRMYHVVNREHDVIEFSHEVLVVCLQWADGVQKELDELEGLIKKEDKISKTGLAKLMN